MVRWVVEFSKERYKIRKVKKSWLSNSTKIRLLKSNFYVKDKCIFSDSFFNQWYQFNYEHILWKFILMPSVFETIHFQKWSTIFEDSSLCQFTKFNFLWGSWFLAQNLSNFVSLPWKLNNPYYHSTPISNFTNCIANLLEVNPTRGNNFQSKSQKLTRNYFSKFLSF